MDHKQHSYFSRFWGNQTAGKSKLEALANLASGESLAPQFIECLLTVPPQGRRGEAAIWGLMIWALIPTGGSIPMIESPLKWGLRFQHVNLEGNGAHTLPVALILFI